ncbi:hypothetical protein Syun_014628 [Stephania yunnanensis]|uniref:Uncharacterized protein n=1 Tax=Stephania yunnanensis TaxID=152371 RepID=A0AAP0JJQ1_9MAGN
MTALKNKVHLRVRTILARGRPLLEISLLCKNLHDYYIYLFDFQNNKLGCNSR